MLVMLNDPDRFKIFFQCSPNSLMNSRGHSQYLAKCTAPPVLLIDLTSHEKTFSVRPQVFLVLLLLSLPFVHRMMVVMGMTFWTFALVPVLS